MQVCISDEYRNLKLEELRLVFEQEEKKQQEREEQRRIKAQIREEERVQRELERARQEAEDEEKTYEKALEQCDARPLTLSAASGKHLPFELRNCKDSLTKRTRSECAIARKLNSPNQAMCTSSPISALLAIRFIRLA